MAEEKGQFEEQLAQSAQAAGKPNLDPQAEAEPAPDSSFGGDADAQDSAGAEAIDELAEAQLVPDPEGEEATPDGTPKSGAKKRLGAWFGKHTKKMVSQLYESRVDDIEHRARRAVSSAYEDQADDLEERAVRAMRTALTEESDRIKEVIEHAIQIKKREVRLSLLVLVVASLLYLALFWITR